MARLVGKVALVTGASRGIGKAIALRLAQDGADVVVAATSIENADVVAKQIEALGRNSLPIGLNVALYKEVEEMMKSALGVFPKVDILVNNAGITKDNLLVRMTEEQWDRVLEVNLKGSFNCIRALAKSMMKQRAGKIINISSIVGVIGNAGQANYCASKAGIIGLTKSVARELASRNIQVNAIAPGYIETDMTGELADDVQETLKTTIPLGRIGRPEEIAAAATFLASDQSDYITGQVIQVDGGMGI